MEKPGVKNILFVDDEERFLTILTNELGNRGHNFCILTAGNGEKALNILESTQVDLVVTDLRMPLMNGFDLVSQMKERHSGIPVIVVSSFLYPELEAQLRTRGVSHCVDKASLSIGVLEDMIVKVTNPRVNFKI